MPDLSSYYTYFDVSTLLDPNRLWLSFSIERNVLPGEAIPVTWTLSRVHVAGQSEPPLLGQTLRCKLSLVDERGNSLDPPIQTFTTSNRFGTRSISVSDASIRRAIYRLGAKLLKMEFMRLDSTDVLASAFADFEIVASATPLVSLRWTAPSAGGIVRRDWNVDIQLQAVLSNSSSLTAASVSINLVERGQWDGQVRTISGPSVSLLPSNERRVAVTTVRQNWTWLLAVIWIITGPQHNLFSYRASLNVTDDFGNIYSIEAAELLIDIWVPDHKWIAAAGASLSAVIAASLLVAAGLALAGVLTAVAVPGLVAAAGGFYAAAGTAGRVALDPPTPNLKFSEIVEIQLPTMPSNIEGPESSLVQISSIFNRVFAAELLSIEVISRLEGARFSGDLAGFNLQANTLQQILATSREDLSYLANITENGRLIANSLDGIEKSFEDGRRKWLEMVPEDITPYWEKAGFAKEDLEHLRKLISDENIINASLSLADLVDRGSMVTAAFFASRVRDYTRQVIGEESKYDPDRMIE